MSNGTQKSLVRILSLTLLVLLFGTSSGRLSPSQDAYLAEDSRQGRSYQQVSTPVPTTEALLIDLSSTPVATTVPTQEPAPPTAVPTEEPTPTAEPAESGRGTFTVPENTTGASILVERGPADKRYVALTFDAGEGAGYTTEILDFLKEHGIKASFGTTGEWARENPELIQRIVNEGHLLFNHSESHRSWTGVSPATTPLTDAERTQQVVDADKAVEEIANWSMQPFWRPPYGDYDGPGQVLLAQLGYDYTLWWTCDSLAWNGYTADQIVEWCGPNTSRGGPGAIILMHVSQEQDYLSLDQLVADYEAEGFEFVTIDKMIED